MTHWLQPLWKRVVIGSGFRVQVSVDYIFNNAADLYGESPSNV